MKPIIGVIPLVDEKKESLWMLPGYFRVNSYHHQAIKRKAEGLEIMAVSEDGLVEAVEMPGKDFVWAVQWHPEFSYQRDKNSLKIFEEFVCKCT